jgi:hypothetical protein
MRGTTHLLPFLVVGWGACAGPEVPLPKPVISQLAVPCADALPPEVLVLSGPTDPSTCLSASNRARGVWLAVSVTRTGRAAAVEQPVPLCVELGANGEELPSSPW